MEALCRRIGMPEAVTEILLALDERLDPQLDLSALTREELWVPGRAALRDALGEDPDGFLELCCMLRCALAARETYDALGIPEQVYADTFACFPRFVREHRESFGRYGFDRGFWTVRQVSCVLFCIGQLEYELTLRDGKPVLSLHIPSGALLQTDALRQSYLDARALIGRAFPRFAQAPMYCRSWLLSPTLRQLLPPDSNIVRFQRSFSITPLETPCREYLKWVFKNPALPPEQYPEHTRLQRALKAHLLRGGAFTDACGYLIPDPFLDPGADCRPPDIH